MWWDLFSVCMVTGCWVCVLPLGLTVAIALMGRMLILLFMATVGCVFLAITDWEGALVLVIRSDWDALRVFMETVA